MNTVSLCDDIRISDASGPDGPVLRSVRLTLCHADPHTLISFGSGEPTPSFLVALNGVVNEIFARAGVVGGPFRDLPRRATLRGEDFGYGVSGRRAGLIWRTLTEARAEISVAAREVSDAERRRHAALTEDVPGLTA